MVRGLDGTPQTGWSGTVLWQPLYSCVRMVTVRRIQYIAVVLCTAAVLSLGLVALFSNGSEAPSSATAECSPPQPHPPSTRMTVVPNAVETAHRSNNVIQAGMVLCRAGLNESLQPLGEKGAWWVVSQWPAAGSQVPVGSNVVLTARKF